MTRTTETCGCKHDGIRWVVICPACAVQEQAISGQWARDSIARNPNTQYTDDYKARAYGAAEGLV
jgi:hypothetical protein